ncbi:unnamed protein product [Caenorhabditis auriculariae]|uniref:Uncharacterized protein n=1 Tax=Caenorhabditis auriculariae TaxID=2777116 RepID=A0A8S1H5Z7_9PELO|nr:unnamed protein product [Caenorhabditis auriculariae]
MFPDLKGEGGGARGGTRSVRARRNLGNLDGVFCTRRSPLEQADVGLRRLTDLITRGRTHLFLHQKTSAAYKGPGVESHAAMLFFSQLLPSISLILVLNIHLTLASRNHNIDSHTVEILLHEIRKRLQIAPETPLTQDDPSIANNEVEEGSGQEHPIMGITGVPLLTTTTDRFPTPSPDLESSGETMEREQLEQFTLTKMKQLADLEHKDRLIVNHQATINMLRGLDVQGSSGGYHRALSGGYLPPHTYDPHNVNWFSYGDDSDRKKNAAIAQFRRVMSN